MFAKFTSLALALTVTLIVASAASAGSPPSNASLLIRHQVQGCHTWSANHDAFKASQSITLRRGGLLTVTNNDVMPHKLVLTSGPALHIATRDLGPHGRLAEGRPDQAGDLPLHDEAGRGLSGMSGMKTTGEDNVLKLTVVVS
jgi:hypothetical protein